MPATRGSMGQSMPQSSGPSIKEARRQTQLLINDKEVELLTKTRDVALSAIRGTQAQPLELRRQRFFVGNNLSLINHPLVIHWPLVGCSLATIGHLLLVFTNGRLAPKPAQQRRRTFSTIFANSQFWPFHHDQLWLTSG